MRPSVPMSKRFGVCFDESMILQQPGALRPPRLTEPLLMILPFASLTAWLALAAYAGLSWHFLAHAHGWRIPWRRALPTEHLLVAATLVLHLLALLPFLAAKKPGAAGQHRKQQGNKGGEQSAGKGCHGSDTPLALK